MKYENLDIPKDYLCSRCRASGLKLWRQYNSAKPDLICAACAAPGVEVDADGKSASEFGENKTDQLEDVVGKTGSLVPAVPTEDEKGYWGYTSVPLPGCAWWRALPVKAGQSARPFYISPEEAAAEQKMLTDRKAYEEKSLSDRDRWRRNTVFCVEATSYEQHSLWAFWASDSVRRAAKPSLKWKRLSGELATVGHDNKRPICVSIQWVEIDGQTVMFYHPTSQLVDWKKIEKWLEIEYAHVPKWDHGTRRAHCDADNFHHCRDAIREHNVAAKKAAL